jgi:NADH-quinone oxidoreductase subunit N
MNTVIALSVLAVVTMFLGIFNLRRFLLPVAGLGLVVSLGLSVCDWGQTQSWYHNMFVTDNFSAAFGGLMIFSTLCILLIPTRYLSENDSHLEAIYALILFSLIGGLLMISASNLVTFFVGLEILSISLYILAASHKTSVFSNEAGMKYFIMGSFASAFLLLGIALMFGATNSLYYQDIFTYINTFPGTLPTILKAGIILVAIGMAFKVAAAPFHFWAPDVYHGSPTLISVYMITTIKVAGFAAFLRLTQMCFGTDTSIWAMSLAVISAISIVVGNFSALAQTKTKRMLAYSSVAHTGYFLLALVSVNKGSASIFLYYSLAYVLSNIVAFAVIIQLKQSLANSGFEAFNGLARKNRVVALSMAIAMLSLTGIPPLAGFLAKYLAFTSAIQYGFLWLVLIAIAGSVVSIFYYFKPVINMYMKPADELEVSFPKISVGLIIVLSLLTIVAGVAPGLFMVL